MSYVVAQGGRFLPTCLALVLGALGTADEAETVV